VKQNYITQAMAAVLVCLLCLVGSRPAWSAAPGTPLATGYNTAGQLGVGGKQDQLRPTPVAGLTNVTAFAGGSLHTLALKSDGTVWAWGHNDYGKLGLGNGINRDTPAQVTTLTGVTAIAAGDDHSLALRSDGTVWGWGKSDKGQVGNGTTVHATQPVQITSLTGITAIAAGAAHSLALKSDGTVWTWGQNASGCLGDGTTTDRPAPVQVNGLTGAVAISGGDLHSIAARSDGTVWAWGSNNSGALGDGTSTMRLLPVQSTGLSGITALAAGDRHNLALKNNGTVWAWGSNGDGQLGDGTASTRRVAVQVAGLTGATAVACGTSHSVALKSDGTVWTWGNNQLGQLGEGSTTSRSSAQPLESISAGLSIAAGDSFTLLAVGPANDGLEAEGDNAVFYRNSGTAQTINVLANDFSIQNASFSITGVTPTSHGTLANSGSAVTYRPTAGFIGEDSFTYTITDSQGHTSTAAVKIFVIRRGTILAWGHNRFGQLGDGTTIDRHTPVPVVGLTGNIVQLAAGSLHSLALKSDGTVWGWGNNINGELGTGSISVSELTAVQATGLSDVKAIAAGYGCSFALKNDGTVWSWGWNVRGQLGDGTTTNRSSAVMVAGLSNVKAIAMSMMHCMALKTDGTVWAWGDNFNGQIGDGTVTAMPPFGKTAPVQVVGLSGVAAIAAGDLHSLALKSNGTVWVWGNNAVGQLGIGAESNVEEWSPVAVPGLAGITRISAGYAHSSASGSGPTTWSWGRNSSGDIGNGTTQRQDEASSLIGVDSSSLVAWGNVHGMALGTDGRVKTWGGNDFGQLGDGTRTQRNLPAQLDSLVDITLISSGTSFSLAKASILADPAAANDAFSVLRNSGANALDVLANDEAGAEALSIAGVTQGANGSVAITGGGTGLTYTPAPGFSGLDSFTYTIGGGAPATVSITVVPTYDVSGRVATGSGTGLANVAISISPVPPGFTSAVLTNANGNYTLANLPNGTYTLTPLLTGYSFTPATRTVTVAGANITAQDFTAVPWASLSGTVRDSSNVAVSGVIVAISPAPAGVAATATTNASGAYSFPRVPPGTYTLTPTRAGNSFNPASRGIAVATANVANLNFTAGPGYTISGRIAWSNGVGMANVKVTRTQSSTPIYTNASGYYTFTGVPNGSYQITPSLAPYSMLPAYTVAVVNGANVGNINFTGGYTINGRIYNSAGAAIVNVSVLRTGSPYPVYTNTAGYYTFGGVAPGTYTVTPTLAGYGFAPQTRSMTITDANSVNQNFVASSGYILSGRVMTSTGAAIPNVTVMRSGSTLTAVTNSSGYYTFTGVPNGTYTVTPTLSGRTFAPVNKSVTVSGANVGNQNFIGS